MRILVVSTFFPPDFRGGFEISASLICDALVAKGHEVHVLTRRNGPDDTVEQRDGMTIYRSLQVNTMLKDKATGPSRLDGWRSVSSTYRIGKLNLPKVRMLLGQHSFDLGLCFSLEGIGASIATEIDRHRIPVLYSIGDFWLFQRRDIGSEGLLARLNRATYSRKYVQMELGNPWRYAIFNCENVRNKFEQAGLSPDHAFIVNRSCPPLDSLLPYDSPEREPVFMVASQLRPHKGIHLVIEAAAILQQKFGDANWQIRIYGDGEPQYIEECKALVVKCGLESKVEFMGKRTQHEIALEMNRSMAFIHPATWDEPFGRVTMEALAYAVPLICANSDFAYEIPTEECALIYDRFSPQAMAEKMELILTQPALAKNLVEKGRARYTSRFRPEIEAQRMEEVIAQVLDFEKYRMA